MLTEDTMDSKHAAEHITGATCRQLLEQYKDYVPPDLKELDHIRYVTIPEVIQSRRTNDKKGPFLTKSELESLMQWKLYVKHPKCSLRLENWQSRSLILVICCSLLRNKHHPLNRIPS